ncbi:MAG: HAMP domain-containing sensor histidine kinase [Syntrophobacteraceae bacterium]
MGENETRNGEERLPDSHPSSKDLAENIYRRVREKKENYRRYNFERTQEEAFATFFDLAQEFTTLESMYQICVAVPREFFGLVSRLYVINPKRSLLEFVCDSETGLIPPGERDKHGISVLESPIATEDSWLFPVKGNRALADILPFLGQGLILGVLQIFSKEKPNERKRFFMEKFTNRIGFNLHQKLLVQQNINHLKFINQLVSDIEHNVITPNMYYRLFLTRLKKMIGNYEEIAKLIEKIARESGFACQAVTDSLKSAASTLRGTNSGLRTEFLALSKHYEHTSLFLETLFRKDHFQKGTYVLRKQSCNFRTEIIEPLLERYSLQFGKRHITLDYRLENVPDEQVTLFVDKGLISQVFDNFFSNALKYTEEVTDQFGHRIKLFSINRQILQGFFSGNKPGVRFNFFTTGKPLTVDQAARIFEEGFRVGSAPEAGSGHGLHFVKNVIEIHGGQVGCEPQMYGNVVCFILPFKA